MSLGKTVRINRIFSHPSGNLCSVAVDHFMGYDAGLTAGLRDVKSTLAAIMPGAPDAVTLHKGMAAALWQPYAGKLPLILQSTLMRPDDSALQQIATAQDAIRLGADALAVAAFVRGSSEAQYLRNLADAVREASHYELPVICHIYPRDFSGAKPCISFRAEDVEWAVRCAVEAGADIVKAPFCGDAKAQRDIVSACPVPLVAAGGPQCATLEAALGQMADAVESGVRGATIGRNIWGTPHMKEALIAYRAVIHDGVTSRDALAISGYPA